MKRALAWMLALMLLFGALPALSEAVEASDGPVVEAGAPEESALDGSEDFVDAGSVLEAAEDLPDFIMVPEGEEPEIARANDGEGEGEAPADGDETPAMACAFYPASLESEGAAVCGGYVSASWTSEAAVQPYAELAAFWCLTDEGGDIMRVLNIAEAPDATSLDCWVTDYGDSANLVFGVIIIDAEGKKYEATRLFDLKPGNAASISLSATENVLFDDEITARWSVAGAEQPYARLCAKWIVSSDYEEDDETLRLWWDEYVDEDNNIDMDVFLLSRTQDVAQDSLASKPLSQWYERDDLEDGYYDFVRFFVGVEDANHDFYSAYSQPIRVKYRAPYATLTLKKSASKSVYLGRDVLIRLSGGKSAKGFSSSNRKVATVTNAGLVTPLKEGTTKITVKLRKGKKLVLKLTVKDPTKPERIKLREGTKKSIPDESTLQLGYTIQPATAADTAVTWKSSNPSVATVSSSGLVTAVKPGKAVITARAGKKKATIAITVTKLPMLTGDLSSAMGQKLSTVYKRLPDKLLTAQQEDDGNRKYIATSLYAGFTINANASGIVTGIAIQSNYNTHRHTLFGAYPGDYLSSSASSLNAKGWKLSQNAMNKMYTYKNDRYPGAQVTLMVDPSTRKVKSVSYTG